MDNIYDEVNYNFKNSGLKIDFNNSNIVKGISLSKLHQEPIDENLYILDYLKSNKTQNKKSFEYNKNIFQNKKTFENKIIIHNKNDNKNEK